MREDRAHDTLLPEVASNPKCKNPRTVDTLSLGGNDYDITDLPLDELASDVASDMADDDLIHKWSLEGRLTGPTENYTVC